MGGGRPSSGSVPWTRLAPSPISIPSSPGSGRPCPSGRPGCRRRAHGPNRAGRNHERALSARPGRLRRASAAPALAGRGPHRAQLRAQLRGGRRALGAARRPGLRGLPARGAGRCAARGRAQPQRRIGLRIRRPRRLLAGAPDVRRARPHAHRLCGGHGARAPSAGGARDGRIGLRGREPRLALDRLSRRARGGGARAHPPRDRGDRADHGDPSGRLVHRTDQPEHAPPGRRGGRLPLRFRTPMRTICPTGSWWPARRSSSSPTPSTTTT